ncbi:hypothetical protein IFR05_012845 [Cadophora sp. M221]|nr:hypothetical protein IFR05_012845 [Cadophora sp. M221]
MAFQLLEDAEALESNTWSLPGLDFKQFYAAAYYLKVVQLHQKRDMNTTPAFDRNLAKAEPLEITNLFLDLLALLFARFKKKDHSPGNVTATALIKEKQNAWKIWIAKNAGPSTMDGVISDQAFLENFKNWIEPELKASGQATRDAQRITAFENNSTKLSSPNMQEPTDPFWSEMLSFWDKRITHYVGEIQKGPKLLPIEEAIASTGDIEFNMVKEVWKKKESDTDEDTFEEDWKRALIMSECLDGRRTDNAVESWIVPGDAGRKGKKKKIGPKSFGLCFKGYEACYQFRNRQGRQIYPPGKSGVNKKGSPAAAYEGFRRRIKCLEMLGAPTTMWRVFNHFLCDLRKRHITLDIEFVPAFPHFPLEKADLASTVQSWSGLDKSEPKKKVLDELIPANSGGHPPGSTLTRYFHCELQLLRLLHSQETEGKETHEYIGVSKLSCYFCAIIISNGKLYNVQYRTKAGHNQVSPNCAFPFDIAADYGYVLESLLKIQSSMLKRILHEAVKIKNEYTVYTRDDQTEIEGIEGSFASGQVSRRKVLPRFNLQYDGSIWVEALKLGVDGTTRRERVRILDRNTGNTPVLPPKLDVSAEHNFRRSLIPEFMLKRSRGPQRPFSIKDLEFRIGHARQHFQFHYRLDVDLDPNVWAFDRMPVYVKSDLRYRNEYPFRGDIWVFKVDFDSPFYYQNISNQSMHDMDFRDFELSATGELRDQEALLWDRREHAIEESLVRNLRDEYADIMESLHRSKIKDLRDRVWELEMEREQMEREQRNGYREAMRFSSRHRHWNM